VPSVTLLPTAEVPLHSGSRPCRVATISANLILWPLASSASSRAGLISNCQRPISAVNSRLTKFTLYVASTRIAQETPLPTFLHCCVRTLLSDCSGMSIVPCLHRGCLSMAVSLDPTIPILSKYATISVLMSSSQVLPAFRCSGLNSSHVYYLLHGYYIYHQSRRPCSACVAISSICAAPFSDMCSSQADNSSRKLRLRCGCQFP
jgi:hypothetical protein